MSISNLKVEINEDDPVDDVDVVKRKHHQTKLGETMDGLYSKKGEFEKANFNKVDKLDLSEGELIDVEPEIIKDETPELITPKRSKQKVEKTDTSKKTSVIGLLGVVFALFALGWNYFQDISTEQSLATEQIELNKQNEAIGDHTTKLDLMQVNQAKNNTQLTDVSEKLNKMEVKINELNNINNEISDIKKALDKQESKIKEVQKIIQENSANIENAKNHADMVAQKAFQEVKKSKATASSTTDSVDTVDKAMLASIDRWGGNVNAVLKTDSGWTALGIGDSYNGWVLTSVDGNTAFFNKGTKKLKLMVKE